MKIFLDTSALFKLYHRENGTDVIEKLFSEHSITSVLLSEIAKVEFASTVAKKTRIGDINSFQANTLLALFEKDCNKYIFIQIEATITEQAKNLIIKHGDIGLRTLDAIQLSTAVILRDHADLFITSDQLLNTCFTLESLRNKF